MKLNFTGDFGKLSRLGRDIGEAKAKRWIGDLAHNLSVEALALVKEGFATGTDPSGKPWPRKKKKGASGRSLIEMGNLAHSWQTRATLQAAGVYSSAPYALFLHQGTQYIRPHKMVPTRQLPARWKARLIPVFWKNVRWLMKGGRS